MTGLLTSWKETYPSDERCQFVTDGPIDFARWQEAPWRILFVLRESYNRNNVLSQCGFDLPALWREPGRFNGHRRTVERRLAEWSYCFRPLGEKMAITPDVAFKASAVMNIKKLAGGATSSDSAIRLAAKRDSDLIRQQLALLDPTVIVCGGTFSVLTTLLTPAPTLVSSFVHRWNSWLIIDHYHPSAWARMRERHNLVCEEFDRVVGTSCLA